MVEVSREWTSYDGYESGSTPPSQLAPPRGNVVCGYLYGDGIMCHEPAGPDHEHPRDNVGLADAVASSELHKMVAEEAFTRDSAKGLWESLTGAPLPSWAEMRQKYPPLPWRKVDPEALREAIHEARKNDVPIGAATAVDLPGGIVVTMDVDFRAMLKDDNAAWSAKTRLAAVLGREYLATRIVDQLDPETAAQLADRLDTLVSQAVAETEMRISGEVSRVVTDKITAISIDRAQRAKQAEEARRERFHNPPSRLD